MVIWLLGDLFYLMNSSHVALCICCKLDFTQLAILYYIDWQVEVSRQSSCRNLSQKVAAYHDLKSSSYQKEGSTSSEFVRVLSSTLFVRPPTKFHRFVAF